MDAQAMLELGWNVRDKVALGFLGPVGIGKSSIVYEHADRHHGKVVEFIASQMVPSEVSGINMPDKDSKRMEVYDSLRLSSLEDGDILFFDELLEAPEVVLKACLTLIQERRMMSGKKLPNVQIVAASNVPDTPAQFKLSFKQRFIWTELVFSPAITQKYVLDNYGIMIPKYILNEMNRLNSPETAKTKMAWNVITPRSLCKILDIIKENPKMSNNQLSVLAKLHHIDDGSALLTMRNDMQRPDMYPERAVNTKVIKRLLDIPMPRTYSATEKSMVKPETFYDWFVNRDLEIPYDLEDYISLMTRNALIDDVIEGVKDITLKDLDITKTEYVEGGFKDVVEIITKAKEQAEKNPYDDDIFEEEKDA